MERALNGMLDVAARMRALATFLEGLEDEEDFASWIRGCDNPATD